MAPKIKNILIFIVVATALILVYVFFIKKPPEVPALVSTSAPTGTDLGTQAANSSITQDFLTVLLGVRNIKLDDAIFSDPAFATLVDSSILLIPDGTEGRPNPFAPLGSDDTTTTPANTPSTPSSTTTTPAAPPASGVTAPSAPSGGAGASTTPPAAAPANSTPPVGAPTAPSGNTGSTSTPPVANPN